jgi:hypothetical protein
MPLEYHSFDKGGRKLRIIKSDSPTSEIILMDIDPKEKLEKIKEWVEEQKLEGRECVVDFKDRIMVCVRRSFPSLKTETL